MSERDRAVVAAPGIVATVVLQRLLARLIRAGLLSRADALELIDEAEVSLETAVGSNQVALLPSRAAVDLLRAEVEREFPAPSAG